MPSTRTTPSSPLPALVLMIAGIVVVVGLAVLISADLTDGFDRAIIDAVRAPALHDLPVRRPPARGRRAQRPRR